jgi:hypothetical protein
MIMFIRYATQTTPACLVRASGDLKEEIKAITSQMPRADSNGMVLPTMEQMSAWQTLLQALLEDDLAGACNLIEANDFPYQLIDYTDEGNGGQRYLMLKEHSPISLGWGSYLMRAAQPVRELVIEVPHPRYDLGTNEEGVDMFRQLNARALLMAGTHRCANSAYSLAEAQQTSEGTTKACSDSREPYRDSDVAHAPQTIFHSTHQLLVPPKGNTLALQLHAHGRTTCPDLFISNTTTIPGNFTIQLTQNARTHCADFSVGYPNDGLSECSLVGSSNIQGQYSNSAFGPEHFIHLEQSRRLREQPACLIEALKGMIENINNK